jgi:predicted transcriptional regulator of viral defense system
MRTDKAKRNASSGPKAILATLARAAHGGLVSVPDAAGLLGLSRRAAANRLGALARRGWLKRARRGLYLVLPLEAAPGSGQTVEDPWIFAGELYAPCYIGGWSAAEHWGFTEQLFRKTFVVTAANIRRRTERHLGAEFHLVRVPLDQLTGTVLVWRGRERVAVSDRERTIADALVSPHWIGGVRHLAEILTAYGESGERDFSKLLARVEERRRGAALKRLGYLAELLWPGTEALRERALALRTAGVVKLDPAVARRGKLNKRWGLWVNVSV